MSTAKIIQKLQEVCYRDEPNRGVVGDINYFIKGSKFFDFKTSIAGRLEVSNTEKKSWNCCAIKAIEQYLENTRHAIN